MVRKLLLMLAILFEVLLSFESNAQKLVIRMKNGNENSELLNTVQKLYFSNNQVVVDFKTGPNDSYEIADLQKLYFDATVSVDEQSIACGDLVIYPNPAGSSISVKGIPISDGVLRIFGMDSRLVFTWEITSDHEFIDISNLPDGIYLLNASGLTAKFIKK